jgi:hypothetical protein
MSETTHPSPQTGLSQADAILAELRGANGDWVSMPRLCAVSGSYNVHSRIADLRARGHIISQKNEHTTDPKTGRRICASSYRLVTGSAGVTPAVEDARSETLHGHESRGSAFPQSELPYTKHL